jgi:hypothetical protein
VPTGIPHQVDLVQPGAGEHAPTLKKEVAPKDLGVALLELQGHDRNLAPGFHGHHLFLGPGQGPAAAQKAGLGCVDRVAGSLPLVKGDQQVNDIAGVRVDKRGLNVVVGP